MSASQELEIILFNKGGDVRRRVRALAGRITVLRAVEENLLNSYRDALLGIKQEARFSVLVDNKAFTSSQHNFIGEKLNGHFALGDSVEFCLINAGFAATDIDRCLGEYGLGGLAANKCEELTTAQLIALGILAATEDPNRIIFLDDPFTHVSEKWRECLAERLTKFVKEKRGLVIVTRLQQRPNSWVENEYVARIQLERPRQATIGFGGQDPSTEELLNKVRAEYEAKPTALLAPLNGDIVVQQFAAPSNHNVASRGRPHSLLAMTAALCVATVVSAIGAAWFVNIFGATPKLEISKEKDSFLNFEDTQAETALLNPNSQQSMQVVKLDHKPLLDGFPIGIKEAVLLSFENPEAALRQGFAAASYASHSPAHIIEQQSSPIDQRWSNEAESQIGLAPTSDTSESNMEERREDIRRRFLEAIASGADN